MPTPPSGDGIYPQTNQGPRPPQSWNAGKVILKWQGAGNVNFAESVGTDGRFAVWSSPYFDLRPEFQGVAQQSDGFKIGTQPIFTQGNLWVIATVLMPNPMSNIDTMNVCAWEEAHPWDLNDMRPITTEQNVTTCLTTATKPYGPVAAPSRGVSGLALFAPPGGVSGAVRYWRVNMIWRRYDNLPDPTIVIGASFY